MAASVKRPGGMLRPVIRDGWSGSTRQKSGSGCMTGSGELKNGTWRGWCGHAVTVLEVAVLPLSSKLGNNRPSLAPRLDEVGLLTSGGDARHPYQNEAGVLRVIKSRMDGLDRPVQIGAYYTLRWSWSSSWSGQIAYVQGQSAQVDWN